MRDTDAPPSVFRSFANVLSIPPGVDFLSELVSALRDGRLGFSIDLDRNPFALADTLIYVPTRRAAQALRDAFAADVAHPQLLPRIVPLGGLGEIEDRLALDPRQAANHDLPPAVDDLHRRLHLTRLTAAWSAQVGRALFAAGRIGAEEAEQEAFAVGSSLADAFALAGELAGLLDEALVNGVGWEAFGTLATDHDLYWRLTIDFLKIVSQAWPDYLAAAQLVDQVQRQNLLLQAEVSRLEASPPTTPVIVAGSTGSIPATARLIRTIAHLPAGAVVLPGLDQRLDDQGWHAVGIATADPQPQAARAGHAQSTLKRLLERLGITRREVHQLGQPNVMLADRARLVSEALRPAETTDHWHGTRTAFTDKAVTAALVDIALVQAADEHEEALSIAILLRQALEQEKQVAALVTPDRKLARRVAAELQRWNIKVDDSAGCTLNETPAGTLARLVLAAMQTNFAPQAVLELLAHEFVTLGWQRRQQVIEAAAILELAALRGNRSVPGIAGLRDALASAPGRLRKPHTPQPQRRLDENDLLLAGRLIDALEQAFAALIRLSGSAGFPLDTLASALREAVLAVAALPDGAVSLPNGADGAALLDRLDELSVAKVDDLTVRLDEAGSLLDALLREVVVPPSTVGHPRLHIFGLLEARLLPIDVMILGSLNEGSWPPAARADLFLNRPMRMALGLDPPERRIGQTAHDFAQALGARQVFLTRAERADGAPTVASRFLRRLAAFIGEEWQAVEQHGAEPLALARAIDRPSNPVGASVSRPAPVPDLALRPTRLSITAVETLYRDPYAIYARDVLGLSPLEPVEPGMGAADRGNLVHEALGVFLSRPVSPLAEERLEQLIAVGAEMFSPFMQEPEIAAFWWPRFLRMAEWFIADDALRRPLIADSHIEVKGTLLLSLGDGSDFTLSGRADRIDALKDGSLAIIDYKTGMPPGANEVLSGLSPQLTLEAAMAKRGAFSGVGAGHPVSALTYLRLSGTGAGGADRSIKPKDGSIDELADRHLAQLDQTLDRYRKPEIGYPSRTKPRKRNETGDYDHLARVREWSDTAGEAASEDES